jgi:thiol-disulfide isomerase/thioredoxin
MTLTAARLGVFGCANGGFGQGELSALGAATRWLNSPPLTAGGLRGKVVLVQFCTYSCINWLRSLPYVRAWAQKYKDQGLVVVGVHTPEFAFERDLDNVRRAARELRVDYPIAVDNDYALWRAFKNQYWPALYFIDARGCVRHRHFGEGEYESRSKCCSGCWPKPGPAASTRNPSPSTPAAWKPPRTGAA